MKTRYLLLNTAMLFALFTGVAVAEPKNGFGLNAGLASHNMKSTGSSYTSSGLSLGVDYQFALSDSLSISPFLMGSAESTNIPIFTTTANHGMLGIQLRYWAGDMFFGGHLGNYSETLNATVGSTTVSTSANGSGAGLVAGWEKPNGGLYVMGQLDSATVKNSNNNDVKLSGFRLSVGYRWK